MSTEGKVACGNLEILIQIFCLLGVDYLNVVNAVYYVNNYVASSSQL
jgi:hypothetical protein